jgi:hypothetical protein
MSSSKLTLKECKRRVVEKWAHERHDADEMGSWTATMQIRSKRSQKVAEICLGSLAPQSLDSVRSVTIVALIAAVPYLPLASRSASG